GGHHLEVEGRDLGGAHATGHAQAAEHASRRGALADRARGAVLLVVAVRRALAAEAVALHAAGEALAAADRGDVDELALLERLDGDLLADRVAAHVLEPQLDELGARRDAGLREVPRLGAVELARVLRAEGDLQGAVPVGLRRLDLHDAAGRDLDD